MQFKIQHVFLIVSRLQNLAMYLKSKIDKIRFNCLKRLTTRRMCPKSQKIRVNHKNTSKIRVFFLKYSYIRVSSYKCERLCRTVTLWIIINLIKIYLMLRCKQQTAVRPSTKVSLMSFSASTGSPSRSSLSLTCSSEWWWPSSPQFTYHDQGGRAAKHL